MRLGISSYTYGWAIGGEGNRPADAPTALDLIDRAAAFGVPVLQLADNLPPQTFHDDSVRQIAARAAERNISIEVGTRGCDPDVLARFIEIAHTLNSPILRIVIDTPTDHPTEEQVIKRLAAVSDAAREAGVVLAIENHDRFGSAQLVRIVQNLSPQVGICLDTANSLGVPEGPEVVVERLGSLAVNLHLKDFAVTRVPYLQGFVVEGRPAGRGMLDIPWLLERMRAFGKDNISAIAELWVPPEASIEQTIAKESQWAEASVRALRQWIRN
jgi:sugar phosphate isomerase/epimerase